MLPGFLPLPALILSLAAHIYDPPPRPSADLFSSDVKISLGMGHGSGTYLGNGRVLTAYHVVNGAVTIGVVTSSGRVYPAKITFFDKDNDIAIVDIDKAAPLAVASVSCRHPIVGEKVTSTGNPYSDERVTKTGHVAGYVRANPLLPSVIILDVSAAPGMSGGAVRDASGEIIGMTNAVFFVNGTPTPTTYSVPAFIFCPLLKKIGVI